MGKLTISMAIFNSYVSLPEGINIHIIYFYSIYLHLSICIYIYIYTYTLRAYSAYEKPSNVYYPALDTGAVNHGHPFEMRRRGTTAPHQWFFPRPIGLRRQNQRGNSQGIFVSKGRGHLRDILGCYCSILF